jgi:DNA-binding beta-propeller fold protein YncE
MYDNGWWRETKQLRLVIGLSCMGIHSLSIVLWLLICVGLMGTPSRAHAEGLVVLSRGGLAILEFDEVDGAFLRKVAATVTEGFRLPGAIALRPSDGTLYVSSVSTGAVWTYDTATGDSLEPAAGSGLFAPFGIAFDAAGDHLYIVDGSTAESVTSDTIKVLELSSGVLTSVGTNNQADFLGVAVIGSHVYGSDVALGRIVRFPVGGGPGTNVISSGLSQPGALLFGSPSQMFVADSGNDRVVEYLESGGSWSFNREILAPAAGVQEPCGLALAPDGQLTVSGRGSGDVVLVDLASLAVTPLVAMGAGGLQDPKSLAWDGAQLLVASPAGNAVYYFDAAGLPTGIRADGLSASLDAGIEMSPDGSRIYAGSIGGNDILEYDLATGALLRVFGQACPNLPFPFDVALGPDGQLYASCILNSSIEHFDTATGASLGPFVIAGMGGLSSPRNLTFGPNDNLFVSNGTGEILEFEGATGAALGPFVDINGNGGGPIDPYGLRFHLGRLYVASFGHDEVKTFDATTGSFVSTLVPSGSGGLTGPTAVDFGPGGDLFVASSATDEILRFDSLTGTFEGVFVSAGSAGLDDPIDMVFGPFGAVAVQVGPGAAIVTTAIGLTGVLLLTRRHEVRRRRWT